MIEIKDISGQVLLSVPLTENAVSHEELMESDYVKLEWKSDSGDTIPAGSYIEHEGEAYRLLEDYTPSRGNEAQYQYEPEFQSRIMAWDKHPVPLYTYGTDGTTVTGREFDWEFTGSPADAMYMVKQAIKNEAGEDWSLQLADSLPATISISSQSDSIFSVLSNIADECGTEWWGDKVSNTLYLSQCNHGTEVTLAVGENVGVPTVTESGYGFYTRFYAFGSTRNITQDYQGGEATSSIANKRLTLDPDKYPGGYKDTKGHFDDGGAFVSDLQDGEVFTKVLYFDDIYPSSQLAISDVRARLKYRLDSNGDKIKAGGTDEEPVYEQYAIWYFRIEGLSFDPETIIEGETLSASFESGQLAGRDFELSYHEEAKTVNDSADVTAFNVKAGDYEIIIDESTGSIIPGVAYIIPQDGDEVILYNIEMPDEYVASSQSELEEALDGEMEKYAADNNSYEFDSYPVCFYTNGTDVSLGQTVNYVNGDKALQTRAIMVEKRLDYSCQQRIKIGNEIIKGNTQQLKEDVSSANQNIDVITAFNELSTSLSNSYANAQREMLEGFAAIKNMWQFDPDRDNTIYSAYNVWGTGEISAYGYGDGSSSSGAGYMSELGDVTLTSLSSGQVLQWDGSNWVNVTLDTGLDEDALASYLSGNNYITSSSLTWSNITNKPTTVAGYGITDAVTAVSVSGGGNVVTSLVLSGTTLVATMGITALTTDEANELYVKIAGDTMTGDLTVPNIIVTSSIQLGDAYLTYDSTNGALKLTSLDGETVMNFYATGEVSAYGYGGGTSFSCAGYMSELGDVTLTSLSSGQILQWNGTNWVNVTLDTGLDESALASYLSSNNYITSGNYTSYVTQLGTDTVGSSTQGIYLNSGTPTAMAYTLNATLKAGAVGCVAFYSGAYTVQAHQTTVGSSTLPIYLNAGVPTACSTTLAVSITGSAATATKWETARTITLTGSVTGSASIDGSGNVSLATTYAASNTSALDSRYVLVAGDTMTGGLTVPNIIVETSIQLGNAYLSYDSTNGALKLTHSDGSTAMHFYATGEVSAYGVGDGSSSGSSGAGYMSELGDVTLTSLSSGQVLQWDGSAWVNVDFDASKLGTSTVGSATKGIYLSSGTATAMTYSLSATVNSGTASKLAYYSGANAVSAYTSTIGSSTLPMYLNAGEPTACGTSLAVSVTGNAASATKLATARTIWGQSFDGTANVSGALSGATTITATGEIQSSAGNAFRLSYGNYGVIMRNDGTYFYLLLTDSGSASSGSYNSYRPFYMSLSSGQTYFGTTMNTGSIVPRATNNYSLGTSSLRWSTVYGVAGNFSGDVLAQGEVTAYSTSDLRLKSNLQPLHALGILRKIDTYEYDWTDEALDLKSDKSRHGYGLIAQELEAYVPEAVTHGMYGKGYMGINYTKLVPFALSAIKDVDDEVTRLRKRVDELERRLSEYERN